MKIKMISFDIFQTLVDVNVRIPQIWQGILGKSYTREDGIRGAQIILEHYPNSLYKALASDRFYTMREVYLDCAESALRQLRLPVEPETVVEHLLRQHSMAPIYEDVLECMKRLHTKYKIILSSDSNHTMVDGLLDQFIYDDIFISDDLRSYKGSTDGGFFRQVIERTGMNPEEILHIGDSRSDVLGANRAGAVSCWLNRDHHIWQHDIRPDYIIHGLMELTSILNV